MFCLVRDILHHIVVFLNIGIFHMYSCDQTKPCDSHFYPQMYRLYLLKMGTTAPTPRNAHKTRLLQKSASASSTETNTSSETTGPASGQPATVGTHRVTPDQPGVRSQRAAHKTIIKRSGWNYIILCVALCDDHQCRHQISQACKICKYPKMINYQLSQIYSLSN